MIPKDLSRQQALDGDSEAIHQISFTGNLDQDENTIMFFIIKERKETILDFWQTIVSVLQFCFALI